MHKDAVKVDGAKAANDRAKPRERKGLALDVEETRNVKAGDRDGGVGAGGDFHSQ